VSQKISQGIESRSARFGAVILPRISEKHIGGEIGLKNAFFWVITQRVVVISYRCFGTSSRFNLQLWRIQKRLGCWNSRPISSNHRNEIRFINKSEEKTFCILTSTSKTLKFWKTTRMELVLTLCIKTSFYALYWTYVVHSSSKVSQFFFVGMEAVGNVKVVGEDVVVL
jgi:hypothetical protein